MPDDTSISIERRNQVFTRLFYLGSKDNCAVPDLLARLPAPLAGYAGWQPSRAQLTPNIHQLVEFAEEQRSFAVLESALMTPATAINTKLLAEQVEVTQTLMDALAAALRKFATGADELRQCVQSALGGDDVVDSVAWMKPIEAVSKDIADRTHKFGQIVDLVAALHLQKPANRAFSQFVRAYYPMLYRDPIVGRTSARWATTGAAFDSILVGRRTPFIDRVPIRRVLMTLFQNPYGVANVLTVDGPSRAGKSYLSSLIDFLVDTGMRGHPDTLPHTAGQHRFALLRPVQKGALHTVHEVAVDMLSQLGWKHLLPEQYKSDDGWAQEVIFNFRNELTRSDDVVWIVADKYWDFPDPKPVIDYFVGLVREAHLQQGRNKLRLVLIDFPRKPLDEFIDDEGSDAQFERLSVDWLRPTDVADFCRAFAGAQPAIPGAGPIAATALFAAIQGRVDQTLSGAALQQSWCSALKQELAPYW